MIEANQLQRTSKKDGVFAVVCDYFSDVCQEELLSELIQIFNQKQPVLIRVGRYQMLVNAIGQYAVVDNLERILDYFSIVNDFTGFKNSFKYECLDDVRYTHLFDKMKQAGCRQYSLNFVLWQVFARIVPAWVDVDSHRLPLKAKFMPNFSMMQGVSAHVHTVVATCLNAPRTIDELSRIFEQLSVSELNRIFLLSVLTGVADGEVLLLAHKQQSMDRQSEEVNSQKVQKEEKTSEVQRAKKTGFFQRLLKKLKL